MRLDKIMLRDIEDGNGGGMGGGTAPAPAPAPAPSSPNEPKKSSDGSNYYGDADTSEMFSMLEDYLKNDGESTSAEARKNYEEPRKDPREQESQEGETENDELDQELNKGKQENSEDGDKKDEFKPIKVKIGDQEYNVKSEEQVQKLVERSQLAGELYNEYQKVNKEHQELSEDMNYLEKLASESPSEYMDTLADQIPQESLVAWMRDKIKYMKMSDEEKAQHDEYSRAKEAMRREEVLRQKLEEVKKKEAMVKQKQEVSQLQNIQKNLENKYSEVVGKEWFDKVVKLQVQEAARLQSKGEEVSLSRFRNMIEQVVEPIYNKLKPGHKPVNSLRSSTRPGNVSSGQQNSQAPTVESGFDALLKAINEGRIS